MLARAQVLDAGALGLVLVLGALVAALDERTGEPDRGHVDERTDEAGDRIADERLDEQIGGLGTAPAATAPVVSEVLGMMSGMTPVTGSSAAAPGTSAAHEGASSR